MNIMKSKMLAEKRPYFPNSISKLSTSSAIFSNINFNISQRVNFVFIYLFLYYVTCATEKKTPDWTRNIAISRQPCDIFTPT